MLAANTNVVFRVGVSGEMFGKDGDRYSRIGFEKGYLPILTATYTHDGLRYTQRAFAVRPAGEQDGWDVVWVHFHVENPGKMRREGAVHGSVQLVRGAAKSEEGRVVDEEGAVLFKHSPERFALEPGAGADVYFKIPYRPDKTAHACAEGGRLRGGPGDDAKYVGVNTYPRNATGSSGRTREPCLEGVAADQHGPE